jgi:hypothetical protein
VNDQRRGLTYAVTACVAGAGLALYAATRVWVVEVTPRPAPLPVVRLERTGGDLLPWLAPLAVVGLAGAGAVLASRGVGRRLTGGLLALLGLAVAAGGVVGLSRAEIQTLWPLGCLLGGVLIGVAGAWTLARGGHWPVMGARYERGARDPGATASTPSGPAPADGTTRRGSLDTWEALDRGEDPTGD